MIDIYVRVSLVGIELLTIDARIVIASVDTYLRFAEAVNRLDLTEDGSKGSRADGGHYARRWQAKDEGAIEAVKEKVADVFSRETRTKMKTMMRMRTGPVVADERNLTRQRK